MLISFFSSSSVAPSVCAICVFCGVSYSEPDILGWTSGHILTLFTGKEGPKSTALERMGGIELIIIGRVRQKQTRN